MRGGEGFVVPELWKRRAEQLRTAPDGRQLRIPNRAIYGVKLNAKKP